MESSDRKNGGKFEGNKSTILQKNLYIKNKSMKYDVVEN